MIIAKPNPQTLFSFGAFALSSAVLIFWNSSMYFFSSQPKWYNLGIIFLLVPVLGYVLYRIFFQLKRIEVGNNQMAIHFLLYGKKSVYELTKVKSWKEHVIKVGKSTTYNELEIIFIAGNSISIGKKEYTEYDKIISYLKKKAPKKQISS
jgi:hypothetical protein